MESTSQTNGMSDYLLNKKAYTRVKNSPANQNTMIAIPQILLA